MFDGPLRRALRNCRIIERSKTIEKDFEWVGGADAIGKAEKYRKCYFVVAVHGVLRQICWVKRAVDHSLFFGLSNNDFVAGEMGTVILEGGVPKFSEVEDLRAKPKENRTNPKASLHLASAGYPLPRCHFKSTNDTYMMREQFMDWFPVTKPFRWLRAQSGPLKDWPAVGMVGPRDARIDLPPDTECIDMLVEVLPIVDGKLFWKIYPFMSVTGFADDYGVQISFLPMKSARPGMQFFSENLRRFMGPVKPAAASAVAVLPPPAPLYGQ